EGDLTDPVSLARAAKGADTLYHVAADYRLWTRHRGDLQRSNVDGTENVLRAASDAGVAKVVYTSSVAALGLVDGGVADARTPAPPCGTGSPATTRSPSTTPSVSRTRGPRKAFPSSS